MEAGRADPRRVSAQEGTRPEEEEAEQPANQGRPEGVFLTQRRGDYIHTPRSNVIEKLFDEHCPKEPPVEEETALPTNLVDLMCNAPSWAAAHGPTTDLGVQYPL